jgi:hypothetical protein
VLLDSTFQLGDLVLTRSWASAPENAQPLPSIFALSRLRRAASWDRSAQSILELADHLEGWEPREVAGAPDHQARLESALRRVVQAIDRGELAAFAISRPRTHSGLVEQESSTVAPAPMPAIREAPPIAELDSEPPQLDLQAQAETLVQAAQLGVPFCEECEKARRKAA